MKHLLTVLLIVTLFLTSAYPVLACEGDADTDAETSDIDVSGGGYVGDTIFASGTVTLTSIAEAFGDYVWAWADSGGHHMVNYGPEVITSDLNFILVSDVPTDGPAYANASQVYNWSTSFTPTQSGWYCIWHGGWAYAAWGWMSNTGEVDLSTSYKFYKLYIHPDGAMMGSGNIWTGWAGMFACSIGWTTLGDITGVPFMEGWQSGKTLVRELVDVGETSCGIYKIVIPEGTVVEGRYGNQVRTLEMRCIEGELVFKPDMSFSKPVTLYKMVDDKWVEVSLFQIIEGGTAK